MPAELSVKIQRRPGRRRRRPNSIKRFRRAISGHRFYNPSTGRWLSRDPIGENGGLHLYASLDNNVVNFIDILGLQRKLSNSKWLGVFPRAHPDPDKAPHLAAADNKTVRAIDLGLQRKCQGTCDQGVNYPNIDKGEFTSAIYIVPPNDWNTTDARLSISPSIGEHEFFHVKLFDDNIGARRGMYESLGGLCLPSVCDTYRVQLINRLNTLMEWDNDLENGWFDYLDYGGFGFALSENARNLIAGHLRGAELYYDFLLECVNREWGFTEYDLTIGSILDYVPAYRTRTSGERFGWDTRELP